MTALNLTSFEAALKVHYTDLRIKNLVYRNNPWLAAIPKMEAFGGKSLPLPLQVGVPQGRSAEFIAAQDNKILADPHQELRSGCDPERGARSLGRQRQRVHAGCRL